jgi:hypothetical protein
VPDDKQNMLAQALQNLRDLINSLGTSDSRRFARLAWTFGVGVPVVVAPLIGAEFVPGFRALVTVLSRDLISQVIPFSIFIVPLVALAEEFYAVYARKRSIRLSLPWIFGVSLAILVWALWVLFEMQVLHIVQVPVLGGERFEPVVIGPSRIEGKGCDCAGLSDIACIQIASFNPAALDACWGGL